MFDCNKSDIENIKKQIKDTSDTIYTVNQNTAQNPDLVARIESKTAMASLPSNRFDLVCFNIGSSAHIKLEQAFETANRILKDNGVLVFINCDIEINEKL
ncbi:MAG: methyltransferase domain-containing protein [Coxiellaceae bacterium]|nr:MAG: methyltransferase domain-containing protein [Coxiellaceae bacterium]